MVAELVDAKITSSSNRLHRDVYYLQAGNCLLFNFSIGDSEDFFLRVVIEIAEMWPIREGHLTKMWAIQIKCRPLSSSYKLGLMIK